VLDSFPGSERVVRAGGTGPRIFGKQTSVAIGRDRLYIGTGDAYGIIRIGLIDGRVDTLGIRFTPVLVTPADVDAERSVQIAASAPNRHEGIERDFAEHPFPDTLPPYASLLVDSEDMLWVQEYPRAGATTVRWRVLSPQGVVVAHAELPTYLQPYEIGRDYVLGRYVDPVEAIPQVRMHALRRVVDH
jgi:hypothetical protein